MRELVTGWSCPHVAGRIYAIDKDGFLFMGMPDVDHNMHWTHIKPPSEDLPWGTPHSVGSIAEVEERVREIERERLRRT